VEHVTSHDYATMQEEEREDDDKDGDDDESPNNNDTITTKDKETCAAEQSASTACTTNSASTSASGERFVMVLLEDVRGVVAAPVHVRSPYEHILVQGRSGMLREVLQIFMFSMIL
jgi:hypothetical protein